MDETAFAGPTRLDQVTRGQDDAANSSGSNGCVRVIDAHLGDQASASGKVCTPRAQESDIPRYGRHLRSGRVVKHVRLLVQTDHGTPFDQCRVPQVSFAEDSVEQFARWGFDLGRDPPESQCVAVTHFLPGDINA